MGLFSPSEGTPANRDLPSTRDSARTSSRAPIRARLRNRNCRSHSMLYAIVLTTREKDEFTFLKAISNYGVDFKKIPVPVLE